MRRTGADDRTPVSREVQERSRPTAARAAAAARVAGAAANSEAVRRRLTEGARRTGEAPRRPPVTRLAAGRGAASRAASARPAGPAPGRARAIANPSGTGGVLAGAALAAAARAEPHREEETRPRHLKVVQPGTLSAAQRRRRARAVLIATIGAVSVIAFALVYLHVVLAQRQFQIDHLDSQVTRAQASYQNLRLQVAELGSPQHIISTAEGSLGMVQPTKVVYLTPKAAGATGAAPIQRPATTAPGRAPQTASGVRSASQAPQGDANWPQIKSQLAGTP